MREAWNGLTEYRLKSICCIRMSKWGSIQFQNGKWLIFDTNGDFKQISYCPFCGTNLQKTKEKERQP